MMSWNERIRRLCTLVPWTALLLASACGGGDKSPTGPGGSGTTQLDLVALGRVGLPADTQLEDCTPTRFYGGHITIDPNAGSWQIRLSVHDDTGDWGYEDDGQMEADGDTVWFDSAVSGSSYAGTVGGGEVTIMYDWCYNGVPDVQLVFDR